MTTSITLQLHQRDDQVELEIHVQHPMESGDDNLTRSDGAGSPFFLQSITVNLNDKSVIEGQLSPALSHNPSFSFFFSSVHTGDKLAVTCSDNKGGESTSEITIKLPITG